MSAPTQIEREHYARLVGRQITGIQWEDIGGRPLPALLLSEGRDRQPAHAVVLADPEGNGPVSRIANAPAHGAFLRPTIGPQ